MDTNNNSNETSEMESQQQQGQESQHQQITSMKSELNENQQQNQDQQDQQDQQQQEQQHVEENDNNGNSERIELYVKYDASDMLGQESGTQTPIEDEPQGSEETDDEMKSDKIATNTNNNNNNITTDSSNNTNANSDSNNKSTKSGVVCVLESEADEAESIEIELEADNSLLLTSLTSLFPEATGLKYRHPETNTLRGVKLADGKFIEPLDGWSAVRNYICVFNRGSKRKNEDEEETSRKQAKTDSDKPMGENGSDLVVLGLPWTTTEATMKSYFEQYGEVVMVQVKTDPKSGKSRGFGFVRFAKSSIQTKLLSMRHFIDGRWCDVRVPLSKAEAEATKAAQLSRKIFVGRLPDNITTDDLKTHFSEFGTLTDVFIPKPFRNFAFVTFGTSDMAQSIFKHKHVIKGTAVQISEAIPRDNGPNNYGSGSSSGGGNFNNGPQNSSNNYGFVGNANNNIHPFSNSYTHQGSHHGYHQKNNANVNFGASMYPANRKMHPSQSTYYQMPSYASTGPSGSVDTTNYINHSAHSDYGNFGGTATGYNQASSGSVNGAQYYKMQQQQPIMTPNQNHSTYPNQSSYSGHGANFSRGSYGSVWK